MYNKLRNQLRELGVDKAQADEGTSEGSPCIFIRWNREEEIFSGYNELDPFDTEERLNRFKDENLS